MAYASWSVVFGEQPSAAKWNILGTNDAYFDAQVGSGTAWSSWTPTLSGRFDNTKWNKTCKYIQIGKTVHFSIVLTANTTTPMSGGSSDAIFSLPVTAVTNPSADTIYTIGTAGILDSGTAAYSAEIARVVSSTTTACIRSFSYNPTLGGVTQAGLASLTSAVPMTWTTSDEIAGSGTYEAA